MRFTIPSSALLQQLAAINGVITKKPVVPILENFLFELAENTLTVTASDLQTFITTTLPVEAQERVSVAIPAHMLLETLKNLPEQPVTFVVDENSYSIEINAANGRYRLAGENAADFPQIGAITDDISVSMRTEVLKKAFHQTLFVTSSDELRPAMNGVYMDFGQTSAIFVATDGHRLARYTRTDINMATKNPVIIPRKALALLNTLLAGTSQTIHIVLSDTKAYFQLDNMRLVTRLIDERYPDYDNVIPTENPHQLTINRLALLGALKRTAIYANRTTHQVKLNLAGNTLQLCAEDFDFSNEANEQLTCDYEGDALEIGFNAKLLIEILSNITSEEVALHLSEPTKAALILPKEKETHEDILLLIMPVILKT